MKSSAASPEAATRILITIPFSHFCEKARWALDHCGVPYKERGHMPMFHALAARRAGSGHSVPVLVTDQGTIRNSTDILVWADSLRPGTLIPKVLAMQRDVLKLEDRFDLQLGPATRLWAYHCLLSKPRDLMNLAAAGTPAWQRSAFTAAYPLIISMMRKAMDINDLAAERAKRRIDEIFVGVS